MFQKSRKTINCCSLFAALALVGTAGCEDNSCYTHQTCDDDCFPEYSFAHCNGGGLEGTCECSNRFRCDDDYDCDRNVVHRECDDLLCVEGRCRCEGFSDQYCGDRDCGSGEDCSSCPRDCGSCPSCGDGTCNGSDDCTSCPGDCGSCVACMSSPGCSEGVQRCSDQICTQRATCSSVSPDRCSCPNGSQYAGCGGCTPLSCEDALVDADCGFVDDNGCGESMECHCPTGEVCCAAINGYCCIECGAYGECER